MKFRKKPEVVVDAVLYEFGMEDGWEYLGRYFSNDGLVPRVIGRRPAIKTLEGFHIITPGDWIITGVAGERYPCKPDIFAQIYEPVEEEEEEEPCFDERMPF